jgi:hypothetical protein
VGCGDGRAARAPLLHLPARDVRLERALPVLPEVRVTQLQQLVLRRLIREIERLDQERGALLAERDALIVGLVRTNLDYRSIARLTGLSIGRVSQIWSRRPEA